MTLLAIDTSASACSLALKVDETTHVFHEIQPCQQAATLLPALSTLFDEAGVSFESLDAVAFGEGPGSFTGLRIAASVAKALAFSLEIPVVQISSLAALALQAAGQVSEQKAILTAVDARMGEIYWATFEIISPQKIRQLSPASLCRPADLPIMQGGPDDWCGVGNAWQVHGAQMGFHPALVLPDANPRADALLSLAIDALQAGRTVSAEAAAPVYLRDKVTFCKSVLDSSSRGG